ncbi:LysM domain-containing protein [Streptococcaceae bacterium ESL0729]|nr:LysM domain-containing protein [Streptococcaceae bacterium ESL0729]
MVDEEKDFKRFKNVAWKAAATGLLLASFTLATEVKANEYDGIWEARTVDQIQNDLHRELSNGGTVYLIVWGDTLGTISQATNITVEKLASINNIKNVNLIYAGNTLVFCGESVQIYGENKEKLADVPVAKTDRINPQAPIGGSPKAGNGGNSNSTASTSESANKTSKVDVPASSASKNPSASDNSSSGSSSDKSGESSTGDNSTSGTSSDKSGGSSTGGNSSSGTSSDKSNDSSDNGSKPTDQGLNSDGRWTVWYKGYDNSSYDLASGVHRFTSADAALAWIKNYHADIQKNHSVDGAYGTIDLGSGTDNSTTNPSSNDGSSTSGSGDKDSSGTGSSAGDNSSTPSQPDTPTPSTARRWTVWWWVKWNGSNGSQVGNAIVPGSHVFASFEEAQNWLNANGNLAGTPGVGATAQWPSEADGESSQTLYAPFYVGNEDHSQDVYPGGNTAHYFNSRDDAQNYINNTIWPSLKNPDGQAGILVWKGGVIY